MQKILTSSQIREYYNNGQKEIYVDERPILTDVARDELQRLGMKIVEGSIRNKNIEKRVGEENKENTNRPYPSGTRLKSLESQGKHLFKELIKSNKILTGTFIGTPHPVITEFVGQIGLDFLVIDAEHNAMHLETVQKMLQGLSATPAYGVVRIPTISYDAIAGALDTGADALLIPQIKNADDIRRIKEYSQYPPNGRRGAGPSRMVKFGTDIMELASNDRDKRTVIIPQIETVSAIENLDEILDNDFIDMYFIGPGDLSMDMGIFGQFSNPKLIDSIMMIREKTKKYNKRLGIFAGNFDAAIEWYKKGFDMTIVNSELGMLGTLISKELAKVHGYLGDIN